MSDEEIVEKTPLEKSRDIIAQLKEMQHYSRANIEKLSAFWLQIGDELKQKAMAERVETLLAHQGTFQDALETTITDYEEACDQLEPKA